MSKQEKKGGTFRIHHATGHTDIKADDPTAARKAFTEVYPKIRIDRIKLVKAGAA